MPKGLGLAAHLHHLAGELMAHDTVWRQDPPPQAGIAIFGHMQIRTANATCTNTQDQIARARLRIWDILNRHGGTYGMKYGRFHILLLS
jgi:hypothetical protein